MENKSKGKLTVLMGGQYGSEGKGAIARHIANNYDVHIRVGSPNAGHTIYFDGRKHVMQSIPCGWVNPNAIIVIGRGALLNMKRFMMELVDILKIYPDFMDRLWVDEEAGILDEKFHIEEGGIFGEMHQRIGSTGEGVGPARIARIKRDKTEFKQFKDVCEDYGLTELCCHNTPKLIAELQDLGRSILIEGTQGAGLSLLHSHYPYCTSIDTNAAGIISEVGIAPSRVTDVLMVVRSYPIRVAGNSGPMNYEITWEELNERLGKKITPEKTTVTKKVRRIAEWDNDLFNQSMLLNAPTEIALTFADYIDPNLYGAESVDDLHSSEKFKSFVDGIIPLELLKYVGTGPKTIIDIKDGELIWQ